MKVEIKRDKEKFLNIKNKIEKGLDLTFQKLLEKKIKEDGEFVFSENGKVVHVKAREFKK